MNIIEILVKNHIQQTWFFFKIMEKEDVELSDKFLLNDSLKSSNEESIEIINKKHIQGEISKIDSEIVGVVKKMIDNQ
jgi:hypothetical protein